MEIILIFHSSYHGGNVMIDIKGIEEGVLIETNDFNMPIRQLYTDIRVQEKSMSEQDVCSLACSIIGSMLLEGLIRLVRATYREQKDEIYVLEAVRDLTPEETDLILKEPHRWEKTDVFSLTEPYELAITDRGREQLERCL
jgi:hypothetical protein